MTGVRPRAARSARMPGSAVTVPWWPRCRLTTLPAVAVATALRITVGPGSCPARRRRRTAFSSSRRDRPRGVPAGSRSAEVPEERARRAQRGDKGVPAALDLAADRRRRHAAHHPVTPGVVADVVARVAEHPDAVRVGRHPGADRHDRGLRAGGGEFVVDLAGDAQVTGAVEGERHLGPPAGAPRHLDRRTARRGRRGGGGRRRCRCRSARRCRRHRWPGGTTGDQGDQARRADTECVPPVERTAHDRLPIRTPPGSNLYATSPAHRSSGAREVARATVAEAGEVGAVDVLVDRADRGQRAQDGIGDRGAQGVGEAVGVQDENGLPWKWRTFGSTHSVSPSSLCSSATNS